jgi:signal transduction histidine kinase
LLDECGLASAFGWYVEGLAERSHLAITLDVAANVGRLPSDMELAIFRLVQECLTNIHRHSGSKTAFIKVAREGESIRTEIRDTGNGISPERLSEIQSHGSGVGIRGIRERIHQFHGEMKIETSGSGTSVIVSIPIPKEARSAVGEPQHATI